MKRYLLLLIVAAAALIPALSQKSGNPFAGRWDLTLTRGTDRFPSWLEVTEKDGKLDARAQLRTGNVNPVAGLKTEGGKLILTVAAAAPARPAEGKRQASPARPEMTWELTAAGGRLTGTQKQGENAAQIAGVRAPALKRPVPAAWDNPIDLFNGKDLAGWRPINPPGVAEAKSYWAAKNGELTNEGKGANLRTVREFQDFKLHVEYLCPPEENSGIYLRGRYEAQVMSQPPGPPPARRGPGNPYLGLGSIYGMVGPASPPSTKADWQTYDITLIGRWATVIFNGVTTVDNQEVPGITGGAIDSNEASPGPIYFQGDHHGGIRYRNIKITLPKHTGPRG
jgi:hypothetical protein